jgi:IS4 transposase
MNNGKTVFAQIMEFLPVYQFQKRVDKYNGDGRVRNFTCLDQYYCMAFAQLTYRESLRDIDSCLNAMRGKLYHMGIRGPVRKSTIADANESRDWRIYAEFAQILIVKARSLYVDEDFGLELDNTVYAFDSTTIDLCLNLFPWARFRKTKAAVKMHTLLDIRGSIPAFISITDGSVHDVNVLDDLMLEPGAFYLIDRGYLDFKRLYRINTAQAFFFTMAKSNTKVRRLYSRPVDKSTGLRSDQTVMLSVQKSSKDYPEKLRRIVYFDEETGKRLTFLTNNFELPALTVAKLYKLRWRVELFFKWIKQHLRIKSFYGQSPNAVRTQIWIAISVYVLVAILKKELRLEHHSLYNILQVFSVSIFEKVPINQLFTDIEQQNKETDNCIQLNLL